MTSFMEFMCSHVMIVIVTIGTTQVGCSLVCVPRNGCVKNTDLVNNRGGQNAGYDIGLPPIAHCQEGLIIVHVEFHYI